MRGWGMKGCVCFRTTIRIFHLEFPPSVNWFTVYPSAMLYGVTMSQKMLQCHILMMSPEFFFFS